MSLLFYLVITFCNKLIKNKLRKNLFKKNNLNNYSEIESIMQQFIKFKVDNCFLSFFLSN